MSEGASLVEGAARIMAAAELIVAAEEQMTQARRDGGILTTLRGSN